MDCKECKNKKENEYTVETARNAQPVEYFVHEGMMARMERTQKRICVLCVILITLLAASWVGFFVYESQYEDVERDGLKAGNLDSTDKLVNIKKNLLKIEKYESEMDGGYSMGDGYWEAQGSYAGEPMNDGYSNARRGEHWVRGHYSRDGRRMYNRDGGYSYRRRDSRGRYSRADGKEGMMESMKEIMADATTEKEREIIRDAMSKLEKA